VTAANESGLCDAGLDLKKSPNPEGLGLFFGQKDWPERPSRLLDLGDLQRSVSLSLQFFDLINLVHVEHVSSRQGILQGFPVDSSPRFSWGILTIYLSISV